jgi:undecaprenyl phosphate-alpha-L-ara4N flippase subunit ArnE|tara:strand:+ start:6499 stop:6879 length:381 start_codon:yes stop_codon:yes gene_type:complete
MATKFWAIGIVFFTTLLTSTAQIFWKSGIEKLEFNLLSIITNANILIGILLYIIGGILLIISLRGGEVSVLYPIIATSYVWVSILSIYFLNEFMSLYKWLGVFTIIAGIVMIGFGSKTTAARTEGM